MIYKSLPEFKQYIWAGNKLKNKYNKKSELEKISESFEFSVNPLGLSSLDAVDKTVLLKDYIAMANTGKNLLNRDVEMLIKLIDAGEDLSIQVHPSDEYAMKNYGKLGKTEMWYIIENEPDAYIYLGFNKDYDEETVKTALNDGKITDLLNKYSVKPGDFFIIPSGTIHAIGKGITLYEIQENSDLTFRLYDYDRIDKDGKKRELHIEEALKVLNYTKYEKKEAGDADDHSSYKILTANNYFELEKLHVGKYFTIKNSANSFGLITIVSGSPRLDGKEVHLGDSYYVDPDTQVKVEGETNILLARVPSLLLGLDVGGTSVKGVIIDDWGNKVAETKVATDSEKGVDTVLNNMAQAVKNLCDKTNTPLSYFKAIGVGFPGNVDSKKGIVILSNNLNIRNYDLEGNFSRLIGAKVIVENDANCAALGEYTYTDKKKYHDMTLITMGTGIGSGFIINGELFKGGLSSTTELGHIKVKSDSYQCTCGQYGCLEALLSLARIKRDVDKLRSDPETGLSSLISDTDSPLKIFTLEDTNAASKEFVRKYLNNLMLGLIDVANLFQPEVIAIGGGISYQIKHWIPILEKRLNHAKFGGMDSPYIKVVQAALGNDAGAYGACALTLNLK